MEQEDKKRLIEALIGIGVLLLLVLIVKPQNYIRIADRSSVDKKLSDKSCPTFIICKSKNERRCGTFSLSAPILFAKKDDPVKEYYAILHTFWVNREQYDNMICFDDAQEAEARGYKPSEQAIRGIKAFDWLNNRRFSSSTTDTKELLNKIDAVIGL